MDQISDQCLYEVEKVIPPTGRVQKCGKLGWRLETKSGRRGQGKTVTDDQHTTLRTIMSFFV